MTQLSIQSSDSVDQLAPAVRELWLRVQPTLQFDQTLAWNELLARHALEPGESVRILSAHLPSGACVGILPMKLTPPEGLWGVRSARALANYYCSLYSPILDDALAVSERLSTLAVLLRTASQWRIDALDLNPVADEEGASGLVTSALQSLGWQPQKYFRFGNWYLEVGGRSFAEYFAALPSQLRNTVTRKEKKLRAQPELSITIAQSPQEALASLEGYQRIYAASWKKPEPHPEFVPGLVRMLAEQDWLRMGLVKLGNEPIASQIWACKDGVVSIFKLAYDERFAQLSAGSVLTTHLMRHVIDVDRARIIDYLTGDDSYKRDWMSHRRERVGVNALRQTSWRGMGQKMTDGLASALRPLRQAIERRRTSHESRRVPPTKPNA